MPLVGHSMGAYVAVLAVDDRPDLYARVVLVDGGVPLPVPEGVDPDELLAATLGPALERLRTTYASDDAYLDFYRRHPALGPSWDDTIEAYVRYDVLETPEGVRSRAVDAAVRADGRDLLLSGPALDAALRATTRPTSLLVAPAGMFGQEPGLLPGRGRRRVRRGRAGAHRRDRGGHQPLHDPVPGGGRPPRRRGASTATGLGERLEQLVGGGVGVGLPGAPRPRRARRARSGRARRPTARAAR